MEFYYTALARRENFISDNTGTMHRRPGSVYIKSDFGTCPCMYSFDAAKDCPLIIQATPNKFSFILDGQEVVETVETPYGKDDYCDLQYVEDCGAVFLVHPNHEPRILKKTETGFSLDLLGSYPFGEVNTDKSCKLCLEKGGTAEAETATIRTKVVSVGDVITLSNDGGATTFDVTVIEYRGAGVSVVSIPTGVVSGDYEEWDTVNGVSLGNITLTVERANLTAENCAPFTADMVGQQIRYLDEQGRSTEEDDDRNIWLNLTIVEFVDQSTVVVDWGGKDIECTDLFQLPAFYAGKNPSAVWIHQDRLYFGYDNVIVGSKQGDFFNWDPTDEDGTVNPDNAIYKKIAVGKCSDVVWMQSLGRKLIVGTTDNITSFYGSGVGGAFQADATGQQIIEDVGVGDVRPVKVGGSMVLVDAARRRVFSTGAGVQYDEVVLENQTIFADHIGDRIIKKIVYQEYPFPIVWAISDDGGLFSMSYWPGQALRGWSRHRMGGRLFKSGCYVAPFVCDIEVQKTPDRSRDILVLTVKRTVNGRDVYMTEKISEEFGHYTPQESAVFLDASVLRIHPKEGFDGMIKPGSISDGSKIALTDGREWFFGSKRLTTYYLDAPNTLTPEPGRTLVQDGEDWRLVEVPNPGESPEYVGRDRCMFNPPCGVVGEREGFDTFEGLDHLEGEFVTAYIDGSELDAMPVSGGSVPVSGVVGVVGLPYVSEIEPLAYRSRIGTTDGADDPSKVVTVSLSVYRTPYLDVGAPGQNDYMRIGDKFSSIDFPEADTLKPVDFYSGWVRGIPFVDIDNNDTLGIIIRSRGPWPAIIRSMEATIYASGGR